MGKKRKRAEPYRPPTTWDMGPASLAALGDVSEIITDFTTWLSRNRRKMEPRGQEGQRDVIARCAREFQSRTGPDKKITNFQDWISRNPKRLRLQPDEGRTDALARCGKEFLATSDWRPRVEDRGDVDPKTGKRRNPNNIVGVRREAWIDRYLRRKKINDRQHKAAALLFCAWERTQRSPPAIKKINVDTFPKPDDNIALVIDRIGGYHKIARHIPKAGRAIIMHVVVENRPIRAMVGCTSGRAESKFMERLRVALDDLADGLGL